MLALPTGGFARQGGVGTAAKSVKASTGTLPAGTRVTADWQAKPPTRTPQELRRLEAAEARTNRPGPAVTQADTSGSKAFGPQAPDFSSANGRSSILAGPPNQLNRFRDTIVPPSGIAGGNANVSNTQEPSIGANGKYNFQAGNWYATRSVNNGASWQFLDPYVTFGPNFCCDQVVLYEPSRNLMFWLLMGVEDPPPGNTGNHLMLAVSDGDDLMSWCTYTLNPGTFGEPSTTFLDYQDMAFSNDFLYIASNPFPAAGGNKTAMLRMTLDPMVTCSAVGTSFLNVSDWFTFKPVQGATDVMYWASVTPISGVGIGSVIRIYSWAENSGTIFTYDRAIPAFLYMERNSGQDCGSTSGVVENWCQFSDSRILGGYVARGVLGWSFSAKQDGSHPFPFTRRVLFGETAKNYLASSDYWNSSFAIQFMTWSHNARGHIAATFALGGGTSSNIYPGTGLYVQDDFGPIFSYQGGASNACTSGGLYRWGDYLTVRPYYPAGIVWIATAMRNVAGGPCTAGGYSEVRNIIFGRERDANSYHRWKNS